MKEIKKNRMEETNQNSLGRTSKPSKSKGQQNYVNS